MTHDSKDIVYPSIANMISNKAHEEWPSGRTQGNHQGPNAHFLSSLFLEECLHNDSASYRTRWADEKGDEASTQRHSRIRGADRTTYVANSRAKRGDEPYRATPVAIANGLPEKGREAKDSNGHRSQIRCALQGATEIHTDLFEGGNDTCGDESGHASVERDLNQISGFLDIHVRSILSKASRKLTYLPFWPIVWIGWICRWKRIELVCAVALYQVGF